MRYLAVAALFVSSAALAQQAPVPPVGPDNGFFRPTPYNDPSLTRDPVLAAQQELARQQATVAAQEYAAQLAAEEARTPFLQSATPPVPVNNAQARQAELDTAVAQQEAEAERVKAAAQPAPINGAFTGLTGSENR